MNKASLPPQRGLSYYRVQFPDVAAQLRDAGERINNADQVPVKSIHPANFLHQILAMKAGEGRGSETCEG